MNNQENPRNLGFVWESPFGKKLRDPHSSLESTAAGKLIRLRVRVPFSVYQMIVDKFRTIPEWDIYKDSSSKRGRSHPLELKVMVSLYIHGRAATYDNVAMVTYLSSTVIATFFHHFIVCMATLYHQWIYQTPEGPKLEDVLKQYALTLQISAICRDSTTLQCALTLQISAICRDPTTISRLKSIPVTIPVKYNARPQCESWNSPQH
jgi:hypothetical protein